MLSIHKLILLSLVALLANCAAHPPVIDADYVFENINVIPMNEEVVLPNKTVLVKDNTIIAILDKSSAVSINTSNRIDGTGQFLLPGLADMHVHLRWTPQAMFNLWLAHGVTTVTNMRLEDGEGGIDHLQLRADIKAGRKLGPDYRINGKQLKPHVLANPGQVDSLLDFHVQNGFDVIKIHEDLDPRVYDKLLAEAKARGLRVTGHIQHLRPLADSLQMDSIEHIEEFLYVARDPEFGKAAAGSLDNFLTAYLSNLESLAKPEQRAAIVRDVAASGIYLNPSMIIYSYIERYLDDDLFAQLQTDPRLDYLPASVRDEYLGSDTNEYRRDLAVVFGKLLGNDHPVHTHFSDNLKLLKTLLLEMHQAGVPLLLGTDSFGALVPGFSVHQELALMVSAGLTPYQALRTGTVNVANYLGEAEIRGNIEVGKRADFILLAKNPLLDIRHTQNIIGVFSQGVWYSQSDLKQLLQEAKVLVQSDH